MHFLGLDERNHSQEEEDAFNAGYDNCCKNLHAYLDTIISDHQKIIDHSTRKRGKDSLRDQVRLMEMIKAKFEEVPLSDFKQ